MNEREIRRHIIFITGYAKEAGFDPEIVRSIEYLLRTKWGEFDAPSDLTTVIEAEIQGFNIGLAMMAMKFSPASNEFTEQKNRNRNETAKRIYGHVHNYFMKRE